MIPYDTGQASQKWTRKELKVVGGIVALIFCIWAAIAWNNYQENETRRLLARTSTQLDGARKQIAALKSNLKEANTQLAEANSKIMELTSVAARAPQLPVYVKQWKDGPVTHAIALQNQSDEGISVHLTVSNPERSRPREQDCYVPAHKTINTPLRIYPNDTAIVTADGFATRTEKMD